MNTERRINNIKTAILIGDLEKKHPNGFIYVETGKDDEATFYFACDPTGRHTICRIKDGGQHRLTKNNTAPFVELLKGSSKKALDELRQAVKEKNKQASLYGFVLGFFCFMAIYLFIHHHVRSQEVRHLENVVKIDNQIINLLEKQIHEQKH